MDILERTVILQDDRVTIHPVEHHKVLSVLRQHWRGRAPAGYICTTWVMPSLQSLLESSGPSATKLGGLKQSSERVSEE